MHHQSLSLIIASIGASRSHDHQTLQELGALLGESGRLSAARIAISARVFALEAFSDMIHIITRQVHKAKDADFATKLHESLAAILPGIIFRLSAILQHLDLLEDNSPLFGRAISLMTHVIAIPSHASVAHTQSPILTPFSGQVGRASQLKGVAEVDALLQRETVVGLSLVRRLTAVLNVCASRLRHAGDLPPRAATLLAGAGLSGGLPDVALATVSLLLLLVPALRYRQSPPEATSPGAPVVEAGTTELPEATPILTDLLQVLADLLGCQARSENASDRRAMESMHQQRTASLHVDARGWTPASSRAVQPRTSTLQSAPSQSGLADDVKHLDHLIGSGFGGLVLTLVERVVAVLHDRAREGCLGRHALSVVQRALLPQVLTSSCAVFSPKLDLRGLTATSSAAASGLRQWVDWGRPVEASWACRLEASLTALIAIARAADGAILMAEQQVFLLLAYCPLLHFAVLPADNSGQFPAAYAWPGAGAGPFPGQSISTGMPWRRPLHTAWCRALLLVATLLASAPQLGEQARVFVEAYAPRFRHVLCSGLQSGHMAILEEATVVSRVLALLSHRCSLAESLLTETAAPACVFVVSSCLAERSSPSEVFIPITAVERLGAQIPLDSEASPAEVPSVFHQRVGYLALELFRSLLVALLRVASSPRWLSGAGNVATVSPVPAAVGAVGQAVVGHGHSQGPAWPSAPSIFGLKPQGGAGTLVLQDSGGGLMRSWVAVMDAALEGARRILDNMEALHHQQQANFLLVSKQPRTSAPVVSGFGLGIGRVAADSPTDSDAWVPLSLGLAPLDPQRTDAEGEGAASVLSPGSFARGLAPSPKSPRGLAAGLSPPSAPQDSTRRRKPAGATEKGLRYQRMALRPLSSIGGQQALGIVPEFVSLAQLRGLCGSILELACTLLSHFCQATRSSILAGSERSSPGSSVLHGLLSFLHELLSSADLGSTAIDRSVVKYLGELHGALRAWQNLGPTDGDPRHGGGGAASGGGAGALGLSLGDAWAAADRD